MAKEEKIKVTKQVLINFSIGNFKDEVLWDIVPMKANHILLGRPWQFDRKFVYDVHANTYVFSSLGKKFTILPLPPPQENEDKNKIKDDKEKEKGQAFTKELLAYKKSFSKQEVQHHSSFSSQTKRGEKKNSSKKGRVALQRKRASPRLRMESLKMKKVIINSSHPTLTKTSIFWGQILSNKGRMKKAWSLPMMMAHGTCLEEREFLDPFLCFYFV